MILAVDIGNTSIVFGIFNKNKLINVSRIHSNKDNYHKLNFLSTYDIEHVIISSVVPDLTDELIKLFNQHYNINPFIVKYNNIPNLILDIDNPSKLGADRICNTIATNTLYNLPAIVIDMGTATKYDVINVKGHFIGGIISPGIKISASSLFERAALLSKTKFKFPKNVIGKNTESNLQSGIMFGLLDSINGMIKRIINETKWDDCSIIITGGYCELIKNKLDKNFIINPNLTLEGLKFIYQKIIT